MARPSVFRIVLKDVIDFLLIASCTGALTIAIYVLLPRFTRLDMSFYFFEQFIELFFVNPRLVGWLLGLGFGVSTIYFLLCSLANQTTIGGLIAGVKLVDYRSKEPLSLYQAFLLAIGAFVGAVLIAVGPLYSWWLEKDHRGLAEILSRTMFVKRANTSQKAA